MGFIKIESFLINIKWSTTSIHNKEDPETTKKEKGFIKIESLLKGIKWSSNHNKEEAIKEEETFLGQKETKQTQRCRNPFKVCQH